MNIHLFLIIVFSLIPTSNVDHSLQHEKWKQDIKNTLNNYGPDAFAQATQYLINGVRTYITTSRNEQRALHLYNILCEWFSKPKIHAVDAIKESWLDFLEKELKPVSWIEAEKEKFALPTISQQELVQEARSITGLIDERPILSIASAMCNQQLIAITETADLEMMLFHIYHELGHIKYGDTGSKAFITGETFQTKNTIANFDKDFPITSAHLKQIQSYVDRAKSQLDDSSETGKAIKNKRAKVTTFWNPPHNATEFIKTSIGRARESRADTFVAEELLKQRNANEFLNQKKLDPVLSAIRDRGTSDYVTLEGAQDVHPSDVERALYLAGFLLEQGIDVNKELRRWEKVGHCIDMQKMHDKNRLKYVKEPGDFMKAYEAGKQERQTLEYTLWKEEHHAQLTNHNLEISATEYFLNTLQKQPEDRVCKKEALFNYNYLREFNQLPMAESLEQIDRPWLKKLCKPVNLKGSAKDSCAGCCTKEDDNLIGCICMNSSNGKEYASNHKGCKQYANTNGFLRCETEQSLLDQPIEIKGNAHDSCNDCYTVKNKDVIRCLCKDSQKNIHDTKAKKDCKGYRNDDGTLICEDETTKKET